jgi:WD40 repeat protein
MTVTQNIHVYTAKTHEHVHTLVGHIGIVISLATSLSGQFLFSGSLDATIKIWNLEVFIRLKLRRSHAWDRTCSLCSLYIATRQMSTHWFESHVLFPQCDFGRSGTATSCSRLAPMKQSKCSSLRVGRWAASPIESWVLAIMQLRILIMVWPLSVCEIELGSTECFHTDTNVKFSTGNPHQDP